MTTALVLSGGGAKGSFEVGSLQYLYENGFLANIICGTSVGAVNALQLAHGGTAGAQAASFAMLKMVWETEMNENADMYTEAAWLAGVAPRTCDAITRLYSNDIDVGPLVTDTIFFPPYAIGQAIAMAADLVDAYEAFQHASSVFTLAPTRTKLSQRLDRPSVQQSGVELRLVVVSLDSGAIRYITQHGRVIETDGRSVFGPNPNACHTERNAYNAAMNAKAAASHALAQAVDHSLKQEARQEYAEASAKAAQAKAALDSCLLAATAAGTANELTVDLVDGTIASSSIPCAFPPVVLGDEAYVDGGLRWQLPLQTAIDFDPELIVAVNTSPMGVPAARRTYRDATMLDIAERSVFDIELWESQERHLQAARLQATEKRQKVWVVSPRFEVHDTLTIDPGLIDINIAYGYMCTADVVTEYPFTPQLVPEELVFAGAAATMNESLGTPITSTFGTQPPTRTSLFVDAPSDQVQAGLADAIARCRRACWEEEHAVYGKRLGGELIGRRSEVGRVPDPDAVDRVRFLKELLGLMVEARRSSGGHLPPGSDGWADMWERHGWNASDVFEVGNTPWDHFASATGARPPATRRTALVARAPGASEVFFLNPLRHLFTSEAALDPFGGSAVVTEVPAEYLYAIPRGADIN